MKLLTLLVAVVLIILGIYIKTHDWETCAWCGDKIIGEGTQLRELWLCDYDFSKLNQEAGEIFGNEYSAERLEWIYKKVKER